MQVECPSCSKTIKAPDHRAGEVVKCPACGGQMQLPSGEPEMSPSPEVRGESAPAQAPADAETKACPYCGEQILKVARKCRHCRSLLTGPTTAAGKRFQGRRRRRTSSGEGNTALILGIVAFFFCGPVLAPLAIMYGNSARKNPSERTAGTIGMILGIIYLVLVGMVILLMILGAAMGEA